MSKNMSSDKSKQFEDSNQDSNNESSKEIPINNNNYNTNNNTVLIQQQEHARSKDKADKIGLKQSNNNNFINNANLTQINNNNNTTTTTNEALNSSSVLQNQDNQEDENRDTESEEENEVIEESPNGRWTKRNEQVSQRDVPAIDQAFLAMDTENGFEVVWNEINISERKFKDKSAEPFQRLLDQIFTNLVKINHPNIVKFHGYWSDEKNHKPRTVFITEYMSSGSLKQFLRKAKKTNQPIRKPTWKRWCVQLLTALHYLHNCDPPIIHRELSCDTIFIQHNGSLKIGSIAPDIVHTHVKTRVENNWSKNLHFIAPEIKDEESNEYGTPVDIYSFGMIALEMFNMELGGNGDTHIVTQQLIDQSIESLEDEKQQDFVRLCLTNDPKQRPTAYQLLFHPLLFELHTLKLLAAHQFLNSITESHEINLENKINEIRMKMRNQVVTNSNDNSNEQKTNDDIIATPIQNSKNSSSKGLNEFKYSSNKFVEDLSKFLDDVKSGLYPLTGTYLFLNKTKQAINTPLQSFTTIQASNASGTQSPVITESNSETKTSITNEKRKAQHFYSQLNAADEQCDTYTISITVKFEDKTKRGLEAKLSNSDTAISLADELISHGLISETNKEELINSLENAFKLRNDKNDERQISN